ncbi:MAG: DUF3955 domain-containing protein [Colwellia sp.]|uniref:DUF3955 domain-containing protein n=1 Tax=Colwellia sp. TaxID=56799 RepID=UPI001D85EF91|nr:DUF3955 domain-containing protein [Colwellia sp.]NQY47675.1 DUF3955 domain-containing protein [Colwellia sp.]NQZ28717.1 DUF3955 domain-containing protein [Colwellia sp.]
MNILANKTLLISLILLGLGMLSLIAESTFYQFLDNEGVLHESMFLPLGMISIVVGMLFLLFFIIQKIRCAFNKK